MTRVFPFLRPPLDVVSVGPWSRHSPDGTEPLPNALVDWDYSTTLSLLRPVSVDGLRLRELTGLTVLGTVSMTWTDAGRRKRQRGQYLFGVAFAGLLCVYCAAMVSAFFLH